MNNLHTILKYLPNYKILLFFSGLTSILYITFNALSLWLVSSLLSMIFNAELTIKNESIDRIYTYLSNYNQLNQIKILCLLIFGAFIIFTFVPI